MTPKILRAHEPQVLSQLCSHLKRCYETNQSTMMIINKTVLAMFALLLGSTLAVGKFGDVESVEDLPEDQVFWLARLLQVAMSTDPVEEPPTVSDVVDNTWTSTRIAR
jgi:hypothetical protein